MARWFRFYDEALDDPKVQRLAPDLFKAWVNLLCIASKNGGRIPDDFQALAFSLRTTVPKVMAHIQALKKSGLLDDGDALRPHNWTGRQYDSDSSAERMRRHRERKRDAPSDADVTSHVRKSDAADTETEQNRTEAEKKEDAREGALPLPDPPDHGEAIRLWNELADECGLSRCQVLNTERKRKLKSRLVECGGLEGWMAALEKIRGSPFLRGENGRQWRADIDFVLKLSSFTKLMEGAYDRSGGVQGPKPGGLTGFAAVAAELAAGSGDGWLEKT